MFAFNSENLADVRILEVRGDRRLGGHRLIFRVHFSFSPAIPGGRVWLFDLGGDVTAGRTGEAQSFLGRARQLNQQPAFEVHNHAGAREFMLVVDLTRAQVVSLEDLRCGGSLSFTVHVSAIAHNENGYASPLELARIEVPQGNWVDVLGKMGYCELELLEIPGLENGAGPELAVAIQHLRQAEDSFRRGDWRACVGLGRDVVEAIENLLGEPTEVPASPDGLFDGSRTWSQRTRLQALRKVVKTYAAPARHGDVDSVSVQWVRADARMVLQVAAALVAHVHGTARREN